MRVAEADSASKHLKVSNVTLPSVTKGVLQPS